jgi:hypothetical protein
LEYVHLGYAVERHFPLTTGYVLTGDTTLDIDAGLHRVQGRVTLNGGAFASRSSDLRFEDPATGAYAVYSMNSVAAYDILLPDGTWNVTLDVTDIEGLARGERDLGVVAVAGADVTADLDLVVHEIGGSITIGGAPLPDSEEGITYRLRFLDAAEQELQFDIGPGDTWSTSLPDGTWDVCLDDDYLVGDGIVVPGPSTVDLAEQLVDVSGTFVVDGGAPGDWYLLFEDPVSGTSHEATGQRWSTTVHPSVYDVYASTSSSRIRIAEGVPIGATTTLDYTLATTTVTGDLAWAGADPPDDVAVLLRGDEEASGFLTTQPGQGWQTAVAGGTYDIYLRRNHWLGAMVVPIGWDVDLSEDVCLALDVQTYEVGGTVLLNGRLAPRRRLLRLAARVRVPRLSPGCPPVEPG